MSGFKFPGVVWTVLLVGLPLLAAWLEQYFPGALWAAPVAGLLLIIAKVVEAARTVETEMGAREAQEVKPNLWWG